MHQLDNQALCTVTRAYEGQNSYSTDWVDRWVPARHETDHATQSKMSCDTFVKFKHGFFRNPYNKELHKAGGSWYLLLYYGSRKRHSEISICAPENTSLARAKGFWTKSGINPSRTFWTRVKSPILQTLAWTVPDCRITQWSFPFKRCGVFHFPSYVISTIILKMFLPLFRFFEWTLYCVIYFICRFR